MARGKKIQSLTATSGNGHGAAQPEPEAGQLEMFQRADFDRFVQNRERWTSELREVQAELREVNKAAAEQGLSKMALDFITKLRGRVSSEKFTPREALEVVEQVRVMADWSFEQSAAHDAERSAAIEATQPLA